jgi:hypothetical protein
MADSPLVTPDQIEDLAVDVLTRRHPEHLAKLERLRGLRPQTLARLRTIVHFAHPDAQANPSDKNMPAVLIGHIGMSSAERDETERLNTTIQLGVQVSVLGKNRLDTIRKRDWTAWTVAECLLQRMPRNGPVHSIALVGDAEPLATGDRERTLGDYAFVFDVEVVGMLTLVGGLPTDDTAWPPGGPGGAPGRPYDPPVALPRASRVTVTLDKDSIVE